MTYTMDDDVAGRVESLVEGLAAQHGLTRRFARAEHLVDGGFNSMAMVDLMLAIEAEFDLTIPQAEMTPLNFRSIETLSAMLVRVRVEA